MDTKIRLESAQKVDRGEKFPLQLLPGFEPEIFQS